MTTQIDQLYNNAVKCLKTTLYAPYQVEGVRWMIERELDESDLEGDVVSKGGIVADEVGLGKTLMAISMIVANPKKKTLILLPKSLIMQWREQIHKFVGDVKIMFVDKKTVIRRDDEGIYIMSQSMLNCKNTIVGNSPCHNVYWDRIIIDEAHLLRNSKSKIHASCCLLEGGIRWALTATPIMNRMTDFVHLMAWFDVSQFLCQTEREMITSRFFMRRTKEDVAQFNKELKLPACNINVEYIPFESTEELKFYGEVFLQERKLIQNNKKKTVTDLLEHLLRIRQICINPQLYLDGITKKTKTDQGEWDGKITKINKLLEHLQSHKDDDKTLIFCQFIKEMDFYERVFNEKGFASVRLDGSMSLDERNLSVKKFTHNPNIKLFFIQINTGGQGINLQIANKIYIMSPSWNPAIEYQAIGRAHRTGQTKVVDVVKFIISSGDSEIPFIEENIIKLQERKKRVIADILDDERIVEDGTKFSSEDKVSSYDIKGLFNLIRLKTTTSPAV
jgi:SNF2 family DNA or RNA helicase